jgi:hypothetical protein
MAGGAVEVLLVSLSCVPPATPKNPPPFITSLLGAFWFLRRWEPVQHPGGWR